MRIKPDKNTKKITQNGITTVLNNFSYDYRPYVTAAVFIICFVILAVNLFDIQVVKGDQLSQTVSTTKTRTLNISGTRGKILDKNGIPLAVDQKTYNLEFYRDYNTTAQREIYTNSTYQVEYLFEHEGCKVYRFMDMGHYIYFTNCKGDVTSIESDSVRTVNRISRKPIIIKEQTLD